MKQRTLASVSVGEELPPLAIPLSTSLIVSAALASRDFTPVHHDRSAAQAVGMPDVFMNILTSNGLVGRYVTDWAGPDARIRGVKLRLGAPNHPGDTMTFGGRVAAKEGDEVSVEVVGRNRFGSHVTATVRVALPD
ncbi:MAG TPA: MaoC family dehydratase [Myxococcota bacterium]|nr:MaoC family dehydratase [Myxococcota bacterium]